MTNLEYLQSLSAEEFAIELLIFRPSDSCFDNENKNYMALDCTYHKSSFGAIVASEKWLNLEHELKF